MSEVLIVFVTALLSPDAALLPLQLLWINLVTDGLPALALGVDPGDPDVMDRAPRAADESILNRAHAARHRVAGRGHDRRVPRALLRRRPAACRA